MSECDVWEGSKTVAGYGRIWLQGAHHYAHRIVWMQDNGHLQPHEFVCHHCDNPSCINIDHLFIGTAADNNRDMAAKGRHSEQQKNHCPQGHEYDQENTTYYDGRRYCRACHRAHSLAYVQRRRASGAIR